MKTFSEILNEKSVTPKVVVGEKIVDIDSYLDNLLSDMKYIFKNFDSEILNPIDNNLYYIESNLKIVNKYFRSIIKKFEKSVKMDYQKYFAEYALNIRNNYNTKQAQDTYDELYNILDSMRETIKDYIIVNFEDRSVINYFTIILNKSVELDFKRNVKILTKIVDVIGEIISEL